MFESLQQSISDKIEFLRFTLDSIISTLSTIKDVAVSIADIIATLTQILGFIGFRVILLLIITSFVISILNICSPTTKRTNYFLSIGFVIWLAITSNMPLQIVVFKYIAIILVPMLITTSIKYLIRFNKIFVFLMGKKTKKIIAKTNFLPKKIEIPDALVPSILFSSKLPLQDELEKIKGVVLNSEKISLLDNENRIVFPIENKVEQFVMSCDNKDTNIIYCWQSSYGANEIVAVLKKTSKISQKKFIVGGADNSFLLDFLQNDWNWKTIYTNTNYHNEKTELTKEIPLKLINDYKLEENSLIKKYINATDLGVYAIKPFNMQGRILYLGGDIENEIILYRNMLQILNYIVKTRMKISAIILENIKVNIDMANIIKNFSYNLSQNAINVPIFYTKNKNTIMSNTNYLIEYKNNSITMKLV